MTITQRRNRTAAAVAVLLLAVAARCESAPRQPQPVPGWGCFVERGRLQTSWPETCRNMRAAGMNTMCFYPVSEGNLIYQVETALEAGAIRKDVPIILVSNMPALTPGATNEQGWEELPRQVDMARAKAPHGKDWPEIILYGTDEPTSAKQVLDWSRSYHKGGYRCTTALCVPNVQDFIPYLDLLIIHASPGVLTQANVRAIEAAGKEWGVYNVQLRLASPELMRYYAGLWTWKLQPKFTLMWEWQWFAEDNPRGKARPEALAGFAQGVADYMALQGVRDYPTDWDFWPGICDGGALGAAWKADFNGSAAGCVPTNPLAR